MSGRHCSGFFPSVFIGVHRGQILLVAEHISFWVEQTSLLFLMEGMADDYTDIYFLLLYQIPKWTPLALAGSNVCVPSGLGPELPGVAWSEKCHIVFQRHME